MKLIKEILSIWIFTVITLFVTTTITSILLFIAYQIEVVTKTTEEAIGWNVLGVTLSFFLFIFIWGEFLQKQKRRRTKFFIFFKKVLLN